MKLPAMRQRFVRRHMTSNGSQAPYEPPRPVLVSSLEVKRVVTPAGHVVLRPAGELESATVPIFRRAVAEIGPGQAVIVDLAGVPFVDSSGIGALIGAVRRVRQLGGVISLAGARQPVLRILLLTGMDRIVELSGSVDEAGIFLDGLRSESPAPGDPVAI